MQQGRRHALRCRIFEVSDHVVDGVGVLSLLARMAIKRAEDTVDDACICIIGVSVDNKRYFGSGIFLEADVVRQIGKVEQFRISKKEESFIFRYALAASNFRIERRLHFTSTSQIDIEYPAAFNSLIRLKLISSSFTTISFLCTPGIFFGT